MERIWNKFTPLDEKLSNGASKQSNNIPLKRKVFVGMSGGVDSSVVAYLLKAQGYDVTGVYMKNWSEESFGGKFSKYCPWRQDLADVQAVCRKIGIPYKVYNFEREYNKRVIDYFFDGEIKGETPNPDIVCNREIKFGLFAKKAFAEGADYIATGHYVRKIKLSTSLRPRRTWGGKKPSFIASPLKLSMPAVVGGGRALNPPYIKGENQRNALKVARDANKDQSYFLCTLTAKQIERALFPLGDYTKPEVREIAREFGLPTAEKPESMGICFVGEVKLQDFLKAQIAETPGEIITSEGQVVGRHIGLPFYTIGQRQGLNLGGGVPYFVVAKNLKKNQLIVARGSAAEELYQRTVRVKKWNWIFGKPPSLPFACQVRLRHRQEPQSARLITDGKQIVVQCTRKQRAVTPGQFCAVYSRGVLLGGGVIMG